MAQKRQTAHHVWISMLHNGKYVKQMGEWDPNYVEYEGKQIARVNVIATIIGKYAAEDNTYVALTLDDGSAQIRIKGWREDAMAIEPFKVGDLVLVIGKPREYNEEIYISPEVVSIIKDPNLELVRRLQLKKEFGMIKFIEHQVSASTLAQPQPTMTVMTNGGTSFEEERIGAPLEESVVSTAERAPMKEEVTVSEPGESDRQKVLEIIEKIAGEDGAPIDAVVEHSGLTEERVDTITQELLKEGEIYQNRPGRLSILG